jgi:hypothetical protein
MPIGFFLFGALAFLAVYFGIASNIARDRAWRVGTLCVLVPAVVGSSYLLVLYINNGIGRGVFPLAIVIVLGLGGPVSLYGAGLLIRAISSPR